MMIEIITWPEGLQHCYCRIASLAAAAHIEEIRIFKSKDNQLVHKMIFIFRKSNSVEIYRIMGLGDEKKM